jgi:uncharacterized RDD family membrane protein YckC
MLPVPGRRGPGHDTGGWYCSRRRPARSGGQEGRDLLSTAPPGDDWGHPGPPPPPPPPPTGPWGTPGYPPPGGGYTGSNPFVDPAATPFGYLAGWWRRAGATVVDGIIIAIPLGVIFSVAGITGYGLEALDQLVFFVYWTILISLRSSQTIGNRAVGTRVIDANTGGPIGAGRAATRAIVQVVLNLTIVGGILDDLWPLWDRFNQTLHDKAAGSLVIRV